MSDSASAARMRAAGEPSAADPACGVPEGPAPSAALSFRDVSFSYADRGKSAARRQGRQDDRAADNPSDDLLISNLTLEIPVGRVTGIVGPNGCGKSTLLKLADGLLRPTAGSVLVAGDDVASLSAAERARRVAMLPQVHRTPSMSVRDLVMCGRYAHMGVFGQVADVDRAVVDRALAEAGIEQLADKPARSLSGGERQRAFLAMAFAQEARVLLLDEPTTYLDVRAAHQTMRVVRELNEHRGTSVVAVIHDLDLALRACDELVVFDRDGSVLAQGMPDGDGAGSGLSVQDAMGRAFGVTVYPQDTPAGRAYVFF